MVDERGQLAALLDPGASLARVAGQKPGELLRSDDLRLTQHGSLEELCEAIAVGGRRLAGLRGERPEVGLARGQRVAFERRRLALGVVAHQHELAVAGDQHLAVLL